VATLLFEPKRAEFASARERDIAMILANQATVAIRNAKLYSQVPLAEALGALSAKRAAFFSIPRRERTTAATIAVGVIAALTLVCAATIGAQPRLTFDYPAMGRQAADLLLDLIERRRFGPITEVVPTFVEPRASTMMQP